MISGAAAATATAAVATTSSCFTNEHNMYGGIITEDMTTHSNSLLYNLSILKEKAHQAQSLAFSSIFSSPSDHHHHQNQQQQQQQQSHEDQSTSSMAAGMASVTTLIQEIIVTASSMMYTVQQICLLGTTTTSSLTNHKILQQQQHQPENIDWYVDHSYNNSSSTINYGNNNNNNDNKNINRLSISISNNNNTNVLVDNSHVDDIIELNAADILAKYTHYCQICGKGFKRDANLRMHMRAHGDEYKSTSALINPLKKSNASTSSSNNGSKDKEGLLVSKKRKYSCPQEGCRWNRKHVKFQPLKSMICVKNHYKRSHCPKMYVCKRCNQKQFSVLSDLRTHEKHCGDGLKWVCSCGTTFSRKDKLMGHVALFVGHTPIINQ